MEHWEREHSRVERQRERPYCECTKSTQWHGMSISYSPTSSFILVVCQPALVIVRGCSLISLGLPNTAHSLSEEGSAERFTVFSSLLRF